MSSTTRSPRISDLVAARLAAGLSVLFAGLTVVSHRPDVLTAAGATALTAGAAVMLLHRHSAGDVDGDASRRGVSLGG